MDVHGGKGPFRLAAVPSTAVTATAQKEQTAQGSARPRATRKIVASGHLCRWLWASPPAQKSTGIRRRAGMCVEHQPEHCFTGYLSPKAWKAADMGSSFFSLRTTGSCL